MGKNLESIGGTPPYSLEQKENPGRQGPCGKGDAMTITAEAAVAAIKEALAKRRETATNNV